MLDNHRILLYQKFPEINCQYQTTEGSKNEVTSGNNFAARPGQILTTNYLYFSGNTVNAALKLKETI